MTATLEDVDFHLLFGGVAKCDRTDKGVPCGNDAEWVATLLPCMCIRLVCTPCKEITKAQTDDRDGKVRRGMVECARCLQRLRSVAWDRL